VKYYLHLQKSTIMVLEIEKRTDIFGKVEFLVWLKDAPTFNFKCMAVCDTEEQAEQEVANLLDKLTEPKSDIIKQIQI